MSAAARFEGDLFGSWLVLGTPLKHLFDACDQVDAIERASVMQLTGQVSEILHLGFANLP